MNILYCGNDHTEDGLLLSCLSLLKNVHEPLHFYALTMSLETGDKTYFPISGAYAAYMDALVKKTDPDNSFRLIDITEPFQRELPLANLDTRFTPYCMMRLFADELSELPERILYLDYDVLCRKDCREFYWQDISEYEFAGVLDYYGRWFFRRNFLRLDYQNSGVLLLNLPKIRETGLFARCRRRCAEKKMFMPDQSALNKLATRKKEEPRRYNEQRKLQDDTVFQHFTTSFRFFPVFHTVTVKPWQEERMHDLLNIFEYDDLLGEYKRQKAEMRRKTQEDLPEMNAATEIIPIFFSIDDGYAPFLSVALNSIIHNASKSYRYKLIVLYKELSEQNRQRIARLGTDNFEILFVSMENRLDAITDRTSIRLRCDYFTFTIFFRLFIPVMFPEYDKGIYLDSDIVVPGDISELFHTDLGDNLIGAVADHSVVDIPPLAKYIERAVGVEKHHYINSGVLLMDLKQLREARLDQRFFELLNTYHFECLAPDQDYLNALCSGKIAYLPPCWDAMPLAIPVDDAEPVKEPKLIHYNLFSKPWCYDRIQYASYFWHYAHDSGYLEEIFEYKANYGPEKQKADQQSLELLLASGERLAEAPEHFRTVFDSGKESRL